ncbi:MAG TPA: DUF3052 domain-containing protein [Acidimicrobiales bacterium]|nr:DUF3052 domain-containing protein [Acidimicrobiales bacterium]
MAAGYSGTPLPRKLGVTDGTNVALIGAPEDWSIPDLPPGSRISRRDSSTAQVKLLFVRSAAELRRIAPAKAGGLADRAALWIAWPRKAGGHESDLTENLLREVVLPLGLVDVKVAALDDDWSGLKFVRRKELRK